MKELCVKYGIVVRLKSEPTRQMVLGTDNQKKEPPREGSPPTAPGLVLILLQFQLRNILKLAFVEGVLPDMGAHLDTRKEQQATREPREMGLHRGLPSPGCLCLPPFA